MLKKNIKPFNIFLAGQGILNLGEAIRFIAITTLLFDLTASGISAAAGVALSALPSIAASPFAGVLGDRMNESRMLILIDLARFIVIPLFLYTGSIYHIYFLLIVISILDVFYNPSRRKLVLDMTGRNGAVRANSQLTGVNGAAYFAGPMLAGFIIDGAGHAPVVLIAASCCLISGILTLFCTLLRGGKSRKSSALIPESGTAEFYSALRYCKKSPDVRELLLIGIITGFCTISVNLSFYPYAFDILKVTAKGWSLMITIYYGTNLVAMILMRYLSTKFKECAGKFFYAGLAIISGIWLLYAFVRSYAAVLLLQFAEGTIISVCGIILASRFQMITDKNCMARVTGINDILSSAGKLTGLGCIAMIMPWLSFGGVFVLSGVILLLFAFFGSICSGWLKKAPI